MTKLAELIDAQGWNDSTLYAMAMHFIRCRGLESEFLADMQQVADFENDTGLSEDFKVNNEN